MSYGSDTLHCALHGFSDASTTAFATMYLRIVNIDGSITISLLAMKSKVISLKTISIPRLELFATLLLARLMHFARSALQLSNLKCHCWMDSTITLAWESVTFPMENICRQSRFGCAITHAVWWSGPPWLHHLPILVELVFFDIFRCFS